MPASNILLYIGAYNSGAFSNVVYWSSNGGVTWNSYTAPWYPRSEPAVASFVNSNTTLMCAGYATVSTYADCWLATHSLNATGGLVYTWTPRSSSANTPSGVNPATTVYPGPSNYTTLIPQLFAAPMISFYGNSSIVIVISGKDYINSIYHNTVYTSYDMGNSWTLPLTAPFAGRSLASATVDSSNVVYFVGGEATTAVVYN